jgi:hypothetical protein
MLVAALAAGAHALNFSFAAELLDPIAGTDSPRPTGPSMVTMDQGSGSPTQRVAVDFGWMVVPAVRVATTVVDARRGRLPRPSRARIPWARNLRTGEPVDVRLRGRRQTADVTVVTDEAGVVSDYAIIAGDNHQFARFNNIRLDDTGQPNPTDLHLCWVAGARTLRLTPHPGSKAPMT